MGFDLGIEKRNFPLRYISLRKSPKKIVHWLNQLTMKQKFELQYLLKTSPKVLESKISTPYGLAEWFCDDVYLKDGIYHFLWENVEEQAVLLEQKNNQYIRFQWLEDQENGLDTYFEISTMADSITNEITLTIQDFCAPEERQNSIMLWQQQIGNLKRLIGS